MKRIIKAGSPTIYEHWRRSIRGQPNEDYRHLQNPQKRTLHEALLSEQGLLCGYTMLRIGLEISHIEHIKPETLCRTELRGSDLDYNNMIACFPREGMKVKYRYGAQLKDHLWKNNGKHFISPLKSNCENYFIFDIRGQIKPHKNNSNAKETIKVLGLDHPTLTELRKRAIESFIYGPNGDEPLSMAKARAAERDLLKKNRQGEFVEFCIAIIHALEDHLGNLKKKATKRKYTVKQKRKR